MSKRIPQNEWGAIVARREQGESVASIAKSYDCSPPLIYSILNRVKIDAGEAAMEPGIGSESVVEAREELPLAVLRPVVRAMPQEPRVSAEPPTAPSERPAPVHPAASAPSAPQGGNAAPRPSLSLPFRDGGHNNAPRLAAVGGEQRLPQQQQPSSPPPRDQGQSSQQQPHQQQQNARPAPAYNQDTSSNNGDRVEPLPRARAAEKPIALTAALDEDLQRDVEDVIKAFQTAFGKALADRSVDAREILRKAASDLMRAGARTTIVLERLAAPTNRQFDRRDFGSQPRDRAQNY